MNRLESSRGALEIAGYHVHKAFGHVSRCAWGVGTPPLGGLCAAEKALLD